MRHLPAFLPRYPVAVQPLYAGGLGELTWTTTDGEVTSISNNPSRIAPAARATLFLIASQPGFPKTPSQRKGSHEEKKI